MHQAPIKVSVILGTRAQMIKMAPVLKSLQDHGIAYWFLHTGQHRETFEDLRAEFGVNPPNAYVVNMADDAKTLLRFGGWALQAGFALIFRRRTLLPVSGGITLVHGDTASTVFGAALGRLRGNAVLHVESGLRSFKLFDPFPEEINRLLTFRLATAFACSGEWALKNVSHLKGDKIKLPGNTIYDAYQHATGSEATHPHPKIPYCVISIHRFETIYNKRKLSNIVDGLISISQSMHILVVGHPALLHQLDQLNLTTLLTRARAIEIVPRMAYTPFISLMQHAEFVITDGGSNQEELSYMGKPTLILRGATERKEGLEKNALLCQPSKAAITQFLNAYKELAQPPIKLDESPSDRIVDWIKRHYTVAL